MSSYITFSIANKKSYELYCEKFDEIDMSSSTNWFKDYSKAYELLGDYFMLYYCSRSFQPYRVFYEEIGFSYKYKILTDDIINHVLTILKKDLEEVENNINYYNKYGTLHRNINNKKIQDGLDFLDSIKTNINNTQIENLESILINIDKKDDDFEEPISWLQEEYDDLKSSVEIVSSFSQMLNRIGKDNVIIFCFD